MAPGLNNTRFVIAIMVALFVYDCQKFQVSYTRYISIYFHCIKKSGFDIQIDRDKQKGDHGEYDTLPTRQY